MSSGRWRKPCRARSAADGRQCELLEGHPGPHARGRVTFTAEARPGQWYFPALAELDERAAARGGAVIDEAGGARERLATERKRRRRERAPQISQPEGAADA